MLEQVVSSPVVDYLSRGMAAANLRHEVISDNIANVNTPEFKRSSVVFEDLLAKELNLDSDGNKLQMVRTHDRHLPVAEFQKARAVIERDDTTVMRVDRNNVDIDAEMADMAKNQLYYSALVSQLGGHFSNLKNVITSGQS